METTLQLIGGKWKGVILFHLLDGPMRFGALRRALHNCTQRMLTNQLRALESDGLIRREIFLQVPPRVEYSLSDEGLTLEPIILELKRWGESRVAAAAHTRAA